MRVTKYWVSIPLQLTMPQALSLTQVELEVLACIYLRCAIPFRFYPLDNRNCQMQLHSFKILLSSQSSMSAQSQNTVSLARIPGPSHLSVACLKAQIPDLSLILVDNTQHIFHSASLTPSSCWPSHTHTNLSTYSTLPTSNLHKCLTVRLGLHLLSVVESDSKNTNQLSLGSSRPTSTSYRSWEPGASCSNSHWTPCWHRRSIDLRSWTSGFSRWALFACNPAESGINSPSFCLLSESRQILDSQVTLSDAISKVLPEKSAVSTCVMPDALPLLQATDAVFQLPFEPDEACQFLVEFIVVHLDLHWSWLTHSWDLDVKLLNTSFCNLHQWFNMLPELLDSIWTI